jgi:hypothetical protein
MFFLDKYLDLTMIYSLKNQLYFMVFLNFNSG